MDLFDQEAPESHLHPAVIYAECAHMTARAAWMYPGDDEARQSAVMAWATCGVDYIEALAATMEVHGSDPHAARYQLAESMRVAAERLRANPG